MMPMLLPMSIGSPQMASLFGPLLEPMGISACRCGRWFHCRAPAGSVEGEPVQLEPGSVLAVPLVFGDMDLSAAGTVTDVRADGTVLGFGHPMFGEGTAALPMATGFVHFVMPRVPTSFKLAGSLKIRGTVVRDEKSAIAGRAVHAFKTAPVHVTVKSPNQKDRQYNYQVVDHHRLTPTLATLVALRSINAYHTPSPGSTLVVHSKMQFTGDHTLELDTMVPGEQAMSAMMELNPPLMLAMQNSHENLKLKSMDVTAEIQPERRTATIINAQLDQAEVRPGETVGVTVWIQPYGEKPQRLRTTFKIPASLRDGDYPLLISDADMHLSQLASTRPHLFTTRNIDDLMQMMQRVFRSSRMRCT